MVVDSSTVRANQAAAAKLNIAIPGVGDGTAPVGSTQVADNQKKAAAMGITIPGSVAGNTTTITQGGTAPKPNTGVLNADISTPSGSSKKVPPPVVIDSSKAKDDLAGKKAQIDQFNLDTQNHQAMVNQPVTTPEQPGQSGSEDTSQTSPDSGAGSLDKQISDLLTGLDTNQSTIDSNVETETTPLQQQQDKIQAQLDTQAAVALKKLNNIAAGTYPLSPAEQGLLSSTTSIWQSTITAQQTANDAYTGQMTELMASLGINTSAPTEAIGMIHAAITTGESKVADLTAQMSKALADLQVGFQTQDYKMVSDAWDKASTYLTDRVKTLSDMQKAVQDAAHQQKQDMKDYAELSIRSMLDTATFDHKQVEDAINDAFQKQQIDETQRHNLQTEAVSWFNAKDSASSGGGSNFTTTQVNGGAAKAGVPLETFKGYSTDAKNVFINGDIAGTKKTIDDGLDAGTPEEVKQSIADMGLPPEVQNYFDSYIDKQAKENAPPTPEEKQQGFKDTFQELKDQGYTDSEASDEVINGWTDGGKSTLTATDKKAINSARYAVYPAKPIGAAAPFGPHYGEK